MGSVKERIVVTGSGGFIGGHLVQRLLALGHDVVGLDRKTGADLTSCDLSEASKVFHLAAQTNAQCDDVQADAIDNIIVTTRLCQRYGQRIVFASSSMVNYPVTPYAISKRAAEAYVKLAGGAVVRFCNIYGSGGHSVIDVFASSDELTIYGTGEQLRTYAHVGSAVDALLRAEPGRLDILEGRSMSVNEIAARFYSHKARLYLPQRPRDILDARQVG